MAKKKASKSKEEHGRGGPGGFDPAIHIRGQKAAAEFLGIDVRTIRKYKNERGMPMAGPNGDWYVKEFLTLWRKNDDDDLEMVVHRRRDTIAQAGVREARQKLLEIELAGKQGEVHSVVECVQRQLRKQVIILREVGVMRKKIISQLQPRDRAKANAIIKEAERNMRLAIIGSD